MEINSNCQKIVSFFRRLSAPISMEINNDCQLDCQLFFAIIANLNFQNDFENDLNNVMKVTEKWGTVCTKTCA